MVSSKAIDVLKTFSKEEMKDLSLFLASPYFNSNKNLVKLYDALKKNCEKLDDLTEEDLYKIVFPGKSYNYGIFKNLLSELYVLQCKYLAVKRLQFNWADEQTYLLKELIERRLVKHADKVIKDTKDHLAEVNMAVESYHVDFTVEEYSYYSNYIRDQRWIDNLYKLEDPTRMSKKLIIYFLMRLLSHYLFYTTKGLNLHIDLVPVKKMIEDLYKFYRANVNYEVPNIEVLYNIMKIREYPEDTKRYYNLKEAFLKNIDKISIQTLRNGFVYLQEFCSLQTERGSDKFIKENFLIHKLNVKYCGVVYGNMNPDLYDNIVSTGLASGETAYVESFINEYHSQLPKTQWNSSYYYSLALLNFYKNDFDSAIDNLTKIEEESFYTSFRTRELYLMIYYATGQWEGLYSLVNSYKAVVKNNLKMPAEEKKAHQLFVNHIYHLAKIKEASSVNKQGLDVKTGLLLKDIKKEPSGFRPWLLDQANSLLKAVRSK